MVDLRHLLVICGPKERHHLRAMREGTNTEGIDRQQKLAAVLIDENACFKPVVLPEASPLTTTKPATGAVRRLLGYPDMIGK